MNRIQLISFLILNNRIGFKRELLRIYPTITNQPFWTNFNRMEVLELATVINNFVLSTEEKTNRFLRIKVLFNPNANNETTTVESREYLSLLPSNQTESIVNRSTPEDTANAQLSSSSQPVDWWITAAEVLGGTTNEQTVQTEVVKKPNIAVLLGVGVAIAILIMIFATKKSKAK